MNRLVLLAGSLAIVVVSFFVYGSIGSSVASSALKYPDSTRAADAALIKEALEKYKKAHGAYPAPFPSNPIADLKPALVDGGYLKKIPQDPVVPDNYYYTSSGNNYGILIRQLKYAAGKVPAGGQCMTGVGIGGTGWWGQPPECPF